MFEGGKLFSSEDMCKSVDLNFENFSRDDTGSLIHSHVLDEAWKRTNATYNLPQGFLQTHNSLDLVERCDERLLPLWPVSPRPFAKNREEMLIRPLMSNTVLSLDPFAAWAYEKVRASGVPNYRGARVQVNTRVDFGIWNTLLEDYDDRQVIDLMKYGWPSGYESDLKPKLGLPNHASGLGHPNEVSAYLEKEVRLGTMVGPFYCPHFEWARTNPVMVRPKKGSFELFSTYRSQKGTQ